MTVDTQARPQAPLRTRLRIYDSLVNSREFGIQYAASLAAERGRTVEVQGVDVTGRIIETWTASPPARPTDVLQTSQGTPPTEPVGRENREQQAQAQRTSETLGTNNEGDTPDDPSTFSPGIPRTQLEVYQGNSPRVETPLIPSVEAILLTVPTQVIQQFIKELPPIFTSLLPIGVIAGIVRRQPVSLNSLLGLVTGSLLGSVANQLLRSSVNGIRTISGLTGALGAISINRIAGALGGPNIPQNLSTISNVISQTTSSALVISNVVNNVSVLLTGNQALGSIPVALKNIELTTSVALRTAANALSIPTNVIGIVSKIAENPLAAILGGSVSSRIPLRGTNLSLPNLPVLSGLTQRIAPELADTIIPRRQVENLLPTNLRTQVPAIPTRERNSVQVRRDAAPEQVRDFPRPNTPEQTPLVTQENISGAVDYSMKISNNYTLAQVSRNAHFPHRIVPQLGLTESQIIENLSRVAVNILEPIKNQYPGFIITSGFRQGQNRSDHNRGQAVDIQWNGRTADYHLEIARWITENLQYKQLIFEHSPRGSIWLHVAFETGGNRRQNLTMINNRYTPGLINHYGQRRV